MQTCVPPQEIIRRVTSTTLSSSTTTTGVNGSQPVKAQSHSGHHFAEYREVMLNMIEGQASERAEGLLMREMIAADLQTLGAAKYQILVSDYIYICTILLSSSFLLDHHINHVNCYYIIIPLTTLIVIIILMMMMITAHGPSCQGD